LRTYISIDEIRAFRKSIKPGSKLGFVPTMGALHPGHLSLLEKAKSENDEVLCSIFVNPTQFGPNEDFEKYPRILEKDIELLSKAGVGHLFIPTTEIMYGNGHSTFAENATKSSILCGRTRPGHFRGVLTIVLKLFNLIRPDKAYFGQKDYQQLYLIKRLVEDLNLEVNVEACPIVREPDGLAMSSRNVYLDPQQRKQSAAIYRALQQAAVLFNSGERDPEKLKQVVAQENRQVAFVAKRVY
jgi:pantoate--beta-alanine ligase